jgi:Dam-replacing family protein
MSERISNTELGERAEQFVVENVRCPSCGYRLQRYGGNRPLPDVFCSTCDFQAQVKSIRVAARNRIRGAGPRMKGLKEAGGMVPPHFFVWEWDAVRCTAGAIDFVPFIPWSALQFRVLPETMARAADRGRIRLEYLGVLSLPRIRVYDAR